MTLLEDRTTAFIVRVWNEHRDDDVVAAEWRGSIEHVQSGQRVFFRHLETVVEFMKPHLEGIGIDAQHRFWERVSSVISDADDQSVALALGEGAGTAVEHDEDARRQGMRSTPKK